MERSCLVGLSSISPPSEAVLRHDWLSPDKQPSRNIHTSRLLHTRMNADQARWSTDPFSGPVSFLLQQDQTP